MNNYDYLIVGGGMAAAAAAEAIRKIDGDSRLGMISAEPDPPYNRPSLSKALWKGKKLDSIWRELQNVDLNPSSTVSKIDPAKKRVHCDDGRVFNYGKLLLATGGKPRRLPFGDERVIYFRTLQDYRCLRELTKNGKRFAVIGGGFIGSEIAAALKLVDREVVMVFPGKDSINTVHDGDFRRLSRPREAKAHPGAGRGSRGVGPGSVAHAGY